MDEPLSTVSNAAYAAAGFYVIERSTQPEHYLYGACLVLLGIGSGLYHGLPKAAVPTWGQRLDEVGMYLVLTALAACMADMIAPWAWQYPAVVLMFWLAGAHDTLDSFKAVPALSAGCVALMIVSVGLWPAVLSVGVFGAAALVRAWAERQKHMGRARLHDAGHTAWHLATGQWFRVIFALWIISHG